MSITVGGVPITRFQAHPFGYEASDTYRGLVARAWEFEALMSDTEAGALLGVFDAWRAAKALEADPVESGVVGTTVAANGAFRDLSWSNVACWFSSPPQLSGAGIWIRVGFGLVDAAEQLSVLLKEKELDEGETELDYGTLDVGGVTLTLLQDPDSYTDGPSVALTATGNDLVEGPLTARRVREVKGWTSDANAKATLRAWYESQVGAEPATGSWFPISFGRPEKDQKSINGVLTTRHIFNLTLRQMV